MKTEPKNLNPKSDVVRNLAFAIPAGAKELSTYKKWLTSNGVSYFKKIGIKRQIQDYFKK